MKLRNIIMSVLCATLCTPSYGQSAHDRNEPFGMALCTSLEPGSEPFDVTGGGVKDWPCTGIDANRVKILQSSGKDMRAEILDAVTRYSVPTRRTIRSRAASGRYTRRSAVRTFILPWRRRRRCFCILS
uniref:Uncharacterized protein n=1 Tax=uncultured prokaryote TaxID=198431 RepID=A0A0H5Q7K4_9ZZZZ|nr:hypothetical protein [uncultured prokaryote]